MPGTCAPPDRHEVQAAGTEGRWAWEDISGIFQQPKEFAQELKGPEKASDSKAGARRGMGVLAGGTRGT